MGRSVASILAPRDRIADASAEGPQIPGSIEAEAPVVTDQFRPQGGLSTGRDAPVEPEFPPVSPGYPQAAESGDNAVSRETGESAPAETEETGPGPAAEDAAFRVRTAAELAAYGDDFDDMATPLARAAQHSVLARQSAQYRPRMPRPDATRVFVVANQKGGVGKTTSTVNIGSALAQLGQRVLVIDLDPQGNASTALSVEHQRGVASSYDVLVDGVPLADVVQPCQEDPALFVVPATIDLAGAEIELVSVVAREGRLKKAIVADPKVGSAAEAGEDRYDYVFIDCPPSLGLLTLNALVAGNEMMIPIQAEYYALEGLGQLLETVELVRADLNPGLAVSTILVTMYDARTRLAAGVADEVRAHFGDDVLRTTIPRSVRVSEAPSYGQTVMAYDPGSPGALSYLEAAREIASKGAPGR